MKTVISFFYNYINSDAEEKLFHAIYNNDLGSINWLLSQNSILVNCKDKFGETPLHRAAFFGNLEITKLLLTKGADVNIKNQYGGTALFQSIETCYITKNNAKIVELIIANGANINVKDNWGDTPLHKACDSVISGCVRVLLDNKADATIKNNYGKIALNKRKMSTFLTIDIETFKLLYIKSEGNIDESIRNYQLYNTSKLKSVIDLALELKPIMQMIKNLFIKDGIADLLQHSKEHVHTSLPKFESLSTEEDSNNYQKFCNYYEMPTAYFQSLLAKKIAEVGLKELQNLPNIIFNNIEAVKDVKAKQVFDLSFFKDSTGNVITFKQHLCENSLLNKICVSNQREEKDYSVISLKYIAIAKVLKMLANKELDQSVVKSEIPQDLWFEMADFNKAVYHLGDLVTPIEELTL